MILTFSVSFKSSSAKGRAPKSLKDLGFLALLPALPLIKTGKLPLSKLLNSQIALNSTSGHTWFGPFVWWAFRHTFSCCVDNCLEMSINCFYNSCDGTTDKKQWKEGFLALTSRVVCPGGTAMVRRTTGIWSHCICSQAERERWTLICSSISSFYSI